MIGLAVACLVATIAILVGRPALAFMEYDDLREGQLEAAAAMVTIVAAAVLFGRFRREGSRRTLLLVGGLGLLALQHAYVAIATPIVDALGASAFATCVALGGAALGAGVVAVAAFVKDRTVLDRPRATRITLVSVAVGVLGVGAVSARLGSGDPPVFDAMVSTIEDLFDPRLAPWATAWLAAIACAWGAAAIGLSRMDGDGDDPFLEWFSWSALLFAAAYANYALLPSQLTELLYSGDLFLLGAIAVLLVGAVREWTSAEDRLVRSAVSSERHRVAGELRSGVAQELALMAVQTERLGAGSDQVEELARSVERALIESRGAISALDRPADESVAETIAHAATEAADRLGARVSLDLDGGVIMTREWREGLTRFTREAVEVAVRHEGATALTVELRGGRPVTLRVVHDGRPSAPRATSEEGAGTRALRARAEALGGTFGSTTVPSGEAVLELVLA